MTNEKTEYDAAITKEILEKWNGIVRVYENKEGWVLADAVTKTQ